jgi:hypothetical protein
MPLGGLYILSGIKGHAGDAMPFRQQMQWKRSTRLRKDHYPHSQSNRSLIALVLKGTMAALLACKSILISIS